MASNQNNQLAQSDTKTSASEDHCESLATGTNVHQADSTEKSPRHSQGYKAPMPSPAFSPPNHRGVGAGTSDAIRRGLEDLGIDLPPAVADKVATSHDGMAPLERFLCETLESPGSHRAGPGSDSSEQPCSSCQSVAGSALNGVAEADREIRSEREGKNEGKDEDKEDEDKEDEDKEDEDKEDEDEDEDKEEDKEDEDEDAEDVDPYILIIILVLRLLLNDDSR